MCNGGAGARRRATSAGCERARRRCRRRTRTTHGVPQPEVGLIVKFDPTAGPAGSGSTSSAATGATPSSSRCPTSTSSRSTRWRRRRSRSRATSGVGTVLFDIAVNPVSGKLYVSNTEARNEVRFEGPGAAFGSSTVRGHLHEARITVIDGASVAAAPPEQAHRLRRRAEHRQGQAQEPRHAARHGGDRRTARSCTSPPSARRGSASTRRASSRTTPSCRARSATSRCPAAARPASCSTSRAPGSTC